MESSTDRRRLLSFTMWAAVTTVAIFMQPGTAVSAAAAEVTSGSGCSVQDANGVQYFDSGCSWHLVVKRYASKEIEFVSYQDEGQLPVGAALPASAIHGSVYVSCGGCVLQGTYEHVITPSGEYISLVPF
jgi:adenosylmethionine-8-amino-7-oxononanoate aminotransferase